MTEMTVAGWHKSSHSGNGSQQDGCVEVARRQTGIVAVRDSKDPDGPRLTFTAADWQSFTHQLRAVHQGS